MERSRRAPRLRRSQRFSPAIPRRSFAVDDEREHWPEAFGAAAPDGHPRRCQAKRRDGEQCRTFALHFHSFCGFHHRKSGRARRDRNWMSWYGRQAGSKLREALDEMRRDGGELHDLSEELVAARLLCERSFVLFERSCLGPDAEKISMDLRALATAQARESLSHVAALVERSAKVRALSTSVIQPEDIQLIADEMVATTLRVLRAAGVSEQVQDDVSKAVADMPLPKRQARTVVAIT